MLAVQEVESLHRCDVITTGEGSDGTCCVALPTHGELFCKSYVVFSTRKRTQGGSLDTGCVVLVVGEDHALCVKQCTVQCICTYIDTELPDRHPSLWASIAPWLTRREGRSVICFNCLS